MTREAARVHRHFTFGSGHMTSYPLPRGGTIADYWVTVDLPTDHPESHREVLMREFTSRYCPRPLQFSMEYGDGRFEPVFFPGGQLCVITEGGVQ